jgi:ATP-dependent exoDNAse (exonuclease V) beta subunit
MPATNSTTFKGTTLTFTEANHRYVDNHGNRYDSVTTLLKNYTPHFDAPAHAARMQAEGKGSASELLAAWDAKREASCVYGTRVHEVAEDALLGRKPRHTPTSERERVAFRLVWDYARKTILPTLKPVKPEMMVFYPVWQIAGTIDLPCRAEDGSVWLLDWKTNEKLRSEGFNGETCLDPIAHLQNCELTKYGLQLSIYELLLTWAGYVPRTIRFRRAVLWVQPEAGKVEMIELPDLKVEALSVVLDWQYARIQF